MIKIKRRIAVQAGPCRNASGNSRGMADDRDDGTGFILATLDPTVRVYHPRGPASQEPGHLRLASGK